MPQYVSSSSGSRRHNPTVDGRSAVSERGIKDLIQAPFRPIHLVIASLCLVLGFALIAQIRIQKSDPLEGLHEDELVLLLDQLTQSEQELRAERNDLTVQVNRLQSSHSQQEAAQEAARIQTEQTEILAGLVPVSGPGLTMTIQVGTEPIRATTFVTILGELRNAGAEAVDINGNRINAASYIGTNGEGLSVSGEPISPPYRFSIIGDPDTIQPALEIARGAVSRVRSTGAKVEFTRHEELKIVSIAPQRPYRYATAP